MYQEQSADFLQCSIFDLLVSLHHFYIIVAIMQLIKNFSEPQIYQIARCPF